MSSMNSQARSMNILCWNIRGMNSPGKSLALYQQIDISACHILCLQETKKQNFVLADIKNFAPKHFDSFAFSPSRGASGGILVAWVSRLLQGSTVQINDYAVTVKFSSNLNNATWFLCCVYGPCARPQCDLFVQWLRDLHISPVENWLILGDFNFYRSVDNRNKPGANMNDILIFNDIISHLGLLELPLKGTSFTWSNMQDNPLLQQLDWFFTSPSWTLAFSNTDVQALTRSTSDHVPCVVKISTKIPKSSIFRFENYWVQLEGFFEVVQSVWALDPGFEDPAKCISFKLKHLRKKLLNWSRNYSQLSKLLVNSNRVLDFLDLIEELRPLSILEWNFEYEKMYQ